MTIFTLVLLLVGLGFLIYGADLLVQGASELAHLLGVPTIIVGLTIVAFGTSAPEVSVGIISSLEGKVDLSFGNVIGSNIFNIVLILSVGALFRPIPISEQLLRFDVPVMIFLSALVYLLASDQVIGKGDGLLLLLAAFLYTGELIRKAMYGRHHKNTLESSENRGSDPKKYFKLVTLMMLGLTLLVVGSEMVVQGATGIAQYLGLSDFVIGLTVIAIGTSLPELATAIVASLKQQNDIAAGNVVGSNIFNLVFALATVALIAPNGIPISTAIMDFDLPVMFLVSLMLAPLFYSYRCLSRGEALVLLAIFLVYMVTVIKGGLNPDAVDQLGLKYGVFSFIGLCMVLALFQCGIYWRRNKT